MHFMLGRISRRRPCDRARYASFAVYRGLVTVNHLNRPGNSFRIPIRSKRKHARQSGRTRVHHMGSPLVLRPRVIRDVWLAVFGNDPISGHLSAEDQYRVLCPFHSERIPSCDVHLGKNAFTCRSCGASGGVLDVVVLEGLAKNRGGAMAWLKERGVRIC